MFLVLKNKFEGELKWRKKGACFFPDVRLVAPGKLPKQRPEVHH